MAYALISKKDQRAMTFLLLLRCIRELWLQKAEAKSLEKFIDIIVLVCMLYIAIQIVLDDESQDVYAAEFVWPSQAKPFICSALKLIHKNRQEERFTFDVSKCERIFDELYRIGYIKMSHTILPLEELNWRAYCKFHSTFSHATNDCNMLRRQIQSSVNEGRLVIPAMQVDQNLLPVHILELKNPKVLVQPSQVESTKEKNVIIGDERSEKKLTPQAATRTSTLRGGKTRRQRPTASRLV